ncbi:MAG: hypothetical protein M0Z66_08145 [Thermaerobacter sp.]|nr:hypothetical protein [Thermaerobacter sp.]
MTKDPEEMELRRSFDDTLGCKDPMEFDAARWQSRTLRRYSPARRRVVAWPAAAVVLVLLLLAVTALRQLHLAPPPASSRTPHQKPAQHSVHPASISQLERWNNERELYGIRWPNSPAYSSQPAQEIFLLPKGFTIPKTLNTWPSPRLQPLAVINDPQVQIGTGTGTLWNGMQSSLYWLRPASSHVLPPSTEALGISTSPSAIYAAGAGKLFAVPWPSAQYPNRTIFLQARGFSMPTQLAQWPPTDFRVVAVYPVAQLQSHPQLLLSLRVLLAAPGLKIPPGSLAGR